MTAKAAERYLTRRQAAAFLLDRYCHGSPNTLARLATQGTGPVFRKVGRLVVYAESDLIAWAESKLGKRQKSTSDNATKAKPGGFMLTRKAAAPSNTETPNHA